MNNCKICKHTHHNETYIVKEMMFGKREPFEYFECDNCGCLQLASVPENIHTYYDSANYYSFTHRKKGLYFYLKRERTKYYLNGTGILGKLVKNKYPNLSFEALGKLKPDKTTKILDVGCGDGELLYLLSSIGFQNLSGIDPFIEKDIVYNSELTIKKLDISQLDTTKKWDIIMLHHVFEHVNNPLEMLLSIRELLSPTGVAMIRIPTASSYAWKTFKENWFQIDAPRHSFLHSTQSMSILIKQSGLTLENSYYDSDEKQFWASLQYEQDIPLLSEKSYAKDPKNSIFTADQIQDFKARSQKLNQENQGDQIVYLLRKG